MIDDLYCSSDHLAQDPLLLRYIYYDIITGDFLFHSGNFSYPFINLPLQPLNIAETPIDDFNCYTFHPQLLQLMLVGYGMLQLGLISNPVSDNLYVFRFQFHLCAIRFILNCDSSVMAVFSFSQILFSACRFLLWILLERTVTPTNHIGLDRHTSWTNPMGR